jgi:molybdate transport system substrate-binding protein
MTPCRLVPAVLAISLSVALGACAPRSGPSAQTGSTTLTVFAAASLTNAFEDLARTFEQTHPGLDVVMNFGASQALRTQIENGAQADVFASANREEMKALVEGGLVDEDDTTVFARNLLVVVLPADNPADVTDLRDLSRPGLRLIVADPAVPAGRYTLRVLDSLAGDLEWGEGFRDAVLANLVSQEESVRAVLAKVALGEADAGFVYASDAVGMPELVRIELPEEHNPLAEYPLAVLRASPKSSAANDFIAFVLSASGQRILENHGFLPVAD